MARTWARGSILFLFGLTASCGSGDASGPPGLGGPGAGGDGTGGVFLDAAVGDGSGAACAAETFRGEVWPVDLYVMMDQSGSMISAIDEAKTTSKWSAVTTGLGAWLDGEAAEGRDVAVGIQFFPLPVVPISSIPACQQGVACQGGAQCLHTGDVWMCVSPCATSSDCTGTECVDAGVRICANDSCAVEDYATPAVPVGPVGATRPAILQAMAERQPMMYTPTGPALEGAIRLARQHQLAHPSRKSVVVLATDGQPTECPATSSSEDLVEGVKAIAKSGVAGVPSIRTFVVGVIQQGDQSAETNLNAIAWAGGSPSAVIVRPNESLAATFSEALLSITGQALACSYRIPQPTSGTPDHGKVNVVIEAGGGVRTIFYVESESACDGELGGWFYEPSSSDPESIRLCDVTCDEVTTGIATSLSVAVGCVTEVMPPR